jgi:hypothetical protein
MDAGMNDNLQRKLWHDLVDRAIDRAAASGKPFTVERVLDSVGILSWAPSRPQALTYATKMLEATKERADLTPFARSLVAIAVDDRKAKAKHEKAKAVKPPRSVKPPREGEGHIASQK